MKLLLLTHGASLRSDRVAAGNSVRAYYLAKGLMENGIEVVYINYRYTSDSAGEVADSAAADLRGLTIETCSAPQEVADVIHKVRPDVLLVGYWELLEYLPDDCIIPVIVDVLAPRLLEASFENRSIPDETKRMLTLYRRANHFICGNERQRDFLIPWLLLAGFDLRKRIPVDIIPISASPGLPHRAVGRNHSWRFVSGGVAWPWRDSGNYWKKLLKCLGDERCMRGTLTEITGAYLYHPGAIEQAPIVADNAVTRNTVNRRPLLTYGEMTHFLSENCDIGLELSESNIEREFSQSFRSIEYLRCGLPVICNDFLSIAPYILAYNAGWTVGTPEDIPELLRYIATHPEEYHTKSQGAITLINKHYHYGATIEPLIDYLRNPAKPACSLPKPTATIMATELSAARKELNYITHSYSWRWTAPLRTVTRRTTAIRNNLSRMSQLLRLSIPHAPERREGSVVERVARRFRRVVTVIRSHIIRPLVYGRQGRHIAIITRKDVFPANHGAAVKIERSAWAESFHVDSVFLITADWARYYVFEKGKCQERYFPRILRLTAVFTYRAVRKLKALGIPSKELFLYHAVYDWGYFLRLLYIAYRYRIVLYQAEFPGYVTPCLWMNRLFPGHTMLVEHNVEFVRLREQYPDISQSAYEWLQHCEIKACRRVDAVVAVSERDRQLLIENGVPPEQVHYIPHGVDLGLYRKSYDFDLRQEYGIPADVPILVYHGIYSYAPNLEAVMVMANEILPRLAARGLRVKVFAIGGEPPPVSPHPDVIFSGPVDNLAPYLKAADLAVVPLQKGGGTRMKIIEYFAANIPVIATTKAIEGIPITNHKHAWIEDDFDRIADAIVELLKDQNKSHALATAARAYVDGLDWTVIAGRHMATVGLNADSLQPR